MELRDIIAGTSVALRIIQVRLILLLCLFMTFGLFAWAMVQQTNLGVIIAALWGLTIFLPVLFTGKRSAHGVSEASSDSETTPPGG